VPVPPPAYRIEVLGDRHDRTSFSCGVEALDRYFRLQAAQDVRRRLASCVVGVSADDGSIAGYYTLSAASVALVDLPPELARRLPRYPSIPAALLGRLAVDERHRGRRVGETLLFDAFGRALRSEVAAFAFVVDAKNEAAREFYGRYRFRPLSAGGRRLFLPMAEIAGLFA
jgi:ribosomal protein S18 acetylase RimI-like enzyme